MPSIWRTEAACAAMEVGGHMAAAPPWRREATRMHLPLGRRRKKCGLVRQIRPSLTGRASRHPSCRRRGTPNLAAPLPRHEGYRCTTQGPYPGDMRRQGAVYGLVGGGNGVRQHGRRKWGGAGWEGLREVGRRVRVKGWFYILAREAIATCRLNGPLITATGDFVIRHYK